MVVGDLKGLRAVKRDRMTKTRRGRMRWDVTDKQKDCFRPAWLYKKTNLQPQYLFSFTKPAQEPPRTRCLAWSAARGSHTIILIGADRILSLELRSSEETPGTITGSPYHTRLPWDHIRGVTEALGPDQRWESYQISEQHLFPGSSMEEYRD